MSDDEVSSVLPTLQCIIVGIISAFISLHQNSLFISFSLLPFDVTLVISISSLYFLSLLPKERKNKTNEQTQQNRNRVIDTENKQVAARREVDGRKKELSEED